MIMKDEIAIITFKTFIKERLDGNTDSIVDYDLGRLRSDKLYGCPGRKFDPDDTNLMRAIYCVVFGDVWENLSWENSGEGKRRRRMMRNRRLQNQRSRMLLPSPTQKVAIVCDWLVTYAGAERVLEEMLRVFPEADVFSVVDFLPEGERAFLGGRRPRTTFLQSLPGARRHYRTLLPLMPLAVEQLDVTGYDLVLSSSHAVAKGVLTGPDQLHISYVHSPVH